MMRVLRRVGHPVGQLLRRSGRRHGLILLYHRVADPPSDPWALSVTPEHFAEQLDALRRHMDVVPLVELLRDDRRRTSDRAVAVTFDDGYGDNLHAAWPLLRHFDVPWTLFLASGHLGSGRQFWWDQLARALLESLTLPMRLRLSIGGRLRQWTLGPSPDGPSCAPEVDRRWLAWGQPDRSPRHTAFRELYEILQPMAAGARDEIIGEILAQAGADAAGPAGDWPLTPEEAAALASAGPVEIGAHTVSHPLLGSMPLHAQREEIEGSKRQLEDLLGRPIRLFAYPFGRPSDYTDETVALVRAARYDAACSNVGGPVGSGTDRFQLPRFQVHDWDGDELLRRLGGWLDG
jgi:peptidoglycan/xylan/chitin deacetylase (PgdA/CDA1 family)